MSKSDEAGSILSNWWLAKRSTHGYAMELIDGPHGKRSDANRAFYITKRLFPEKDLSEYVVILVKEFEAKENRKGVNESAIDTCLAVIPPNLGS